MLLTLLSNFKNTQPQEIVSIKNKRLNKLDQFMKVILNQESRQQPNVFNLIIICLISKRAPLYTFSEYQA